MDKSSDMSHWQMFESTIFLEWGGGEGQVFESAVILGFFLGGGLHLQYLIKITTSCIENLPN